VVLVAIVLLVCAGFELWSPVAVHSTAAQLGTEEVQNLHIQPGEAQRPEQRPDVLAKVVPVAAPRRRVYVEDLEPLVE
jgi:hypothetical protein